ncbi:MAG: response regulator [Deltaproteobacteria bacterium]|nr:response regulator [Deltaproteobacteria bacterium]
MSATVLLVDSMRAYRNNLASRLREIGITVVEAESGVQAVEAIRKTPVEVAIVDNALTDGSGFELLSALREVIESLKLVLVVAPSFDIDSKEAFCDKWGIARLVQGPTHPNAIRKIVEKLISEEKPQTPDTGTDASGPAIEAMDKSVESHLTEVRRSYQEKLPKELARLEQTLRAARENPSDLESTREAHRLAHALHGTAGTLGFGEVSQAAAQIEEVLKQVLSGATESDSIWDMVFDLLEKAETAPERPSLIKTTEVRVSGIATVLLVDSDLDMLASVELIGHKNLITIVSASNAESALAEARKKKVDGAIIDNNLSGQKNSFELIQELRSLEGLGDLPVAIMSADSSILNRVAATHAGASQFLQKPISAEDLVETARYFGTLRTEVKPKVLILDDDAHFRSHIAVILENEDMDVTSLGEPERILEIIDRVKPDIILLDVVMPGISGFDVCRLLRSTAAWNNVPILFLTAESDSDARLECFRAGGDDYIEKPVIREELLARIGVRLERIRLFRERADRDGLTNLPNRRAFLDLFKIRIAEGRRYDRPLALCIMDLDKFKHINDTYGHLAGDRVLVGLGKLLSERFRTVDIRGRWGGEEFAVVFYGEDAPTAKMILGRVLNEFREITFEGDHGEKFHVTFSCGISTFPRDGTTFDDLFRMADTKLYAAKEYGRCRIEI